MAGAGYRLFNTGDVLTAAQVNTFLQEQVVMRFANATARTTALSGVLAEGMMSYLDDTNSVEVYNGSAWVSIGSTGDITGVTAGTGISGGGTSGDVTITNSMATAIDAKGDLIVGTGADTFARLAVGGTNGHVLQVDSSTATGLKWAASSGGGSMTKITSADFTSVSSVTIDNVFTSTYRRYMCLIRATGSTSASLQLQFRYSGTTQTTEYYGSGLAQDRTDVQTKYGYINVAQATIADGLRSYGAANLTMYFAQVGNSTQNPVFWGNGYQPRIQDLIIFAGHGEVARNYDGFLLLCSAGTMTGSYAIYGLEN